MIVKGSLTNTSKMDKKEVWISMTSADSFEIVSPFFLFLKYPIGKDKTFE